MARILPGSMERPVLTPGPVCLGSRILERRDVQGRTLESEFTVTEHALARKSWGKVRQDGRDAGEGGWELSPDGARTRVTWTVDLRLPGLLKLMTPVVKPMLAKQAEGDLAAVKGGTGGQGDVNDRKFAATLSHIHYACLVVLTGVLGTIASVVSA